MWCKWLVLLLFSCLSLSYQRRSEQPVMHILSRKRTIKTACCGTYVALDQRLRATLHWTVPRRLWHDAPRQRSRVVPQKLSQSAVERIKPSGKEQWITDSAVKGLQLRLAVNGMKSWYFRYRWEAEHVRLPIGEFPIVSYGDAVEQSEIHRKAIREGHDPRASVARQSMAVTVGEVIAQHRNMSKSQRAYDIAMREFLAKFGSCSVAALTPYALKRFIEDEYVERPGGAVSVIGKVRAAYNIAALPLSDVKIPTGLANPGSGIEASISFIKERNRGSFAVAFEDDQWAVINGAIDRAIAGEFVKERGCRMHPIAMLCAKLCLLTGSRPSEITSLVGEEIEDFTVKMPDGVCVVGKRIIKERHKTWAKTGRPRQIIVGANGISVLAEAAKVRHDMGYSGALIFPSPGRGRPRKGKVAGDLKPIANFHSYVESVGFLAGMKLMPYNFRSAYINFAIDHGIPIEVVSENVGHTDIRTTLRHYQRNKLSKLASGAEKADEALGRALRGEL